MSIKDVLKKSFVSSISMAELSVSEILVVLGVTLLLSLYIFFIYRIFTRKTFYNKSFNISLAATALITAAVIITIQSSIVVSLGMVGTGLFDIAAILSIAVTAVIFVLDKVPVMQAPMILMVQAMYCDMENDIHDIVSQYTKYYKVKSRNITPERTSIVMELRVKDGGALVQSIGSLEGILYVSMIDHDGEVTF